MSKELIEAAEAIVKMYVANRGTDHEFISCITPPHASEMTKKERKQQKNWAAWDRLRTAIEQVKKAVVTVDVKRIAFGVMSGEYGNHCYKVRGGDGNGTVGGISLQTVVGRPLGNGAVVELTATVIKQGVFKKNPWLKEPRRKKQTSNRKINVKTTRKVA